jgi:response regulator RpfG family c-di-GMP phosphodiesterase
MPTLMSPPLSSPAHTSPSNATLMIVDDDQAVQQACRLLLRRQGYRTLEAPDSVTALRLGRTHPIDLCLIDLTLPDGHGLDLLEQLREVQPQTLAIVLTGDANRAPLLRSLQLGVKNYILKPFSVDQVVQVVDQTLEQERQITNRIRTHIMEPLFELSERLLVDRDLKSTFRHVVETAAKQTGADVVSLMVLDEATRTLSIEAAVGLPPGVVEGTRIPLGEGIAGWVAAMKEPLILIPGVSDDEAVRALLLRRELTAALCMPLLRKERIVGVLNIGKHQPGASFTQSEIEIMSLLCRQAAVLIDNIMLFDEVSVKIGELETAHFDTIKALAGALESKDFYTRHHSDRTVIHAELTGQRLGLSTEERLHVRYAAILHDIGKIGIPEAILNKPAGLTEEEYAEMKRHPIIGAAIVEHVAFLRPVIPLIRHDHERWDGCGYPDGLKGEEIPLGARIIAVVDAYDAMAVDRVYRKAPGHEFALRELRRCAGTQFDPAVVEAFISAISLTDDCPASPSNGSSLQPFIIPRADRRELSGDDPSIN